MSGAVSGRGGTVRRASGRALVLAGSALLGLVSSASWGQVGEGSADGSVERASGASGEVVPGKALRIGDRVPALRVAEWVRGEATEIEPGRVYVVEFWATWCAPCRESIPHLSGLQRKYGDELVVIGVSSEDGGVGKIAPFVERQGESMSYRVAYDDRQQTMRNYMLARNDSAIPQAFIVDREGRLAWHGHPLEIDGPLDEVIKGEFDLEGAIAYERRMDALVAQAMPRLEALDAVLMEGDFAAGAELAAELAALDYELMFQFALLRYQLLMQMNDAAGANGYARSLVEEHAGEHARALGALAWTIAMDEHEGRDLELALRAAERAVELSERGDADLLDTLARVCFVRGEYGRATDLQREAIAKADPRYASIYERTLVDYEAAARSGG